MGSACSKKKASADRYNVRAEEDAANAAAPTPTSIRGKVAGNTTPTANGSGAQSFRPMRPLLRSLSDFPPGKVHILDIDAIMSGKTEMQAFDTEFEATERLAEVFANAAPCGGCKGLRELGELFPVCRMRARRKIHQDGKGRVNRPGLGSGLTLAPVTDWFGSILKISFYLPHPVRRGRQHRGLL
jgi:hypothetical protein